jgi:hypothetical protein
MNFPMSSSKYSDRSQNPSCYRVLLMQPPPQFKFTNYLYKLRNSTLPQKTKIPRPLSQATASNHHNVFMSTLPLSEGRARGAWEPYNRWLCFSPPPRTIHQRKKVPFISPMTFSFTYYSTFLSCLSRTWGLKNFRGAIWLRIILF